MATKKVPLTQGYVALIDEEDWPLVAGYKWHAIRVRRVVYAQASAEGGAVYMHRVITGAAKGQEVDHINDDGIDNRRANLRICSTRQNQYNSRSRRGSSSRFKGVGFNISKNRWVAEINIEGRRIYLGRHRTEEAAARAYDKAARKYQGEFARLNLPNEADTSTRDTG